MPAAVLALAVVLSLLLAGCVSRIQTPAPAPVPDPVPLAQLAGLTLRVGDQKGNTESLMRAAGALTGTPYAVAFSTFTSGPPEVEALTAGQIDFAVTGNTPPIFGAAAGARVRVVSAYESQAPGGPGQGDRILVRADSPIRTVADLRGRTVAVAKGSSAHGHLLAQLQRAGLTPKDLELAFLQPADGLSAFRGGRADAWAIWDPFTAQAEADLPVRSIAQAVGVVNGANFGLAGDAALGDPRRNTALADFLARLATASAWARDHPEQWAADYGRAVGFAPPVAAASQRRSLRMPVPLSPALLDSEQQLTDLFAATGQITTAPRFADAVDHRFERPAGRPPNSG